MSDEFEKVSMKKQTTRRKFIRIGSIGLGGLMLGCQKLELKNTQVGAAADATPQTDATLATDAGSDTNLGLDTNLDGNPGGDASLDTHAGADTNKTCVETADNIEGPYYAEGIPVRSDLDLYGDVGDALLLSGVVRDIQCNVIENAVVHIWHADPGAVYHNTTAELRYYGQVATDASGAFKFKTLMPGRYLNGSQYRPAHVHCKVFVKGQLKLTTQIYFEDDPYNDIDPFIVDTLIIKREGSGAATFDIVV
ncbi:MAG: hypothetical protein CMH53_09165 [Myxococcales bacterium]|nr:hypothetical protein [Myxococcales bacterium]